MLPQRYINSILLPFFILGTLNSVFAQPPATKAERKSLDVGRVMHITYGSASWNTDSTKIDSAYILLRDKATGKLVQIQLEETEPDSSQFNGQFSVSYADQDSVSPEIYVPPQDVRGKDKDNKKLYDMVKSGNLPRKPVILKKNDRGQSVLEVYDTREQAEVALKAYEDELKLAQEIKKKKPLKNLTNATALAVAQAAERKNQLDKLALEAAQHTQDRVRMEQIERQKAEERMQQEQKMSEQERQKRREQAATLNAEALADYNHSDFVNAESKFKQAVDLDPENKDYYYKYGVTLYRNQKFQDALVALKIAKVDPATETERKYYMGLVHYRLSELDNSMQAFGDVAKSGDPALAPSAVFYQGVIQFAQEQYDPAKKSFEKVIDTSSDPRLDDQAEEYIDKIAAAMAFQKMRENKFTLTGVVGLMYDSNVLLSPDNSSSTATATNISDVRLLTLADLQYRAVFTDRYEWSPHVTANLTNSSKNTAAPADPFLYDLALPFSYKGMALGKGYKLTVNPGYEVLFLDPNATGTKAQELASYFVSVDNTFVMNKDWISLYTAEYRGEKSSDPSSVGPNDLSGTRYTLRTTQTFFMDKSRKSALMPSLGFVRDATKGSAKANSQYNAGVTLVKPIFKDSSINFGLTYYQLTYPDAGPKRTDNDVTFTTGLSRPVRDWVIWGLTGTYTKNSSTDPSYTYTKYVVMTTATFLTNF